MPNRKTAENKHNISPPEYREGENRFAALRDATNPQVKSVGMRFVDKGTAKWYNGFVKNSNPMIERYAALAPFSRKGKETGRRLCCSETGKIRLEGSDELLCKSGH